MKTGIERVCIYTCMVTRPYGKFCLYIPLETCETKETELTIMHQSIPALPIAPSGNRGAFAQVAGPGVGHSQFYRGPGDGH